MPDRPRRGGRRRRASLAHLLDVMEMLPDALIIADAEGCIVAASVTAEQLFAYDPGELVGQPIEMLLPERLRQGHAGLRRQYQEDGLRRAMGPRRGLFGLRKDGVEFAADISLNIMQTSDGDVALCGVRDISERLHMEDVLRASEQNYRELFEGANDIVYTYDFEGVFTAVNPAGLRRFGYTAEEIGSVNITDIIDPQHVGRAREEVMRKLWGVERSEPYELLTHARDGTDVWVEVSTRVVMEDGRAIGVQGIARDITDWKRAEEVAREHEARLRVVTSNVPVAMFALRCERHHHVS